MNPNPYCLSELEREVQTDLRGLAIPAHLRWTPQEQAIRTASLREWEPQKSEVIPMPHDARLTDHVARNERPGGFRRALMVLAVITALLLVAALCFPEIW